VGIEFNPDDPFPLLSPQLRVYALEQEHAAQADAWLGLEVERIERELVEAGRAADGKIEQNWVGLPSRSLLTPYTEAREVILRLKPREGATLVDLGAGYGRMGFVVATHFPKLKFVGYELVPERVREGLKGLERLRERGVATAENVKLLEQDLSTRDFRPIEAEFYFIYDFGSRTAIAKTLDDLREIAAKRSITVIGRGRASRDEIERKHPWLCEMVEPEHLPLTHAPCER
jgi:hypothetical protein